MKEIELQTGCVNAKQIFIETKYAYRFELISGILSQNVEVLKFNKKK